MYLLSERVIHGPSIIVNNNGNYMFYNSDRNNSETATRAPVNFLPKSDEDEAPNKKKTYEVCVAAAERWPGKRRLISLFEANEVAKRLAGRKAQSVNVDENDKQEPKKDEVSVLVG